MLEAHVINGRNRHLYNDTFWDSYFRLRHEIYVVEKKWRQADGTGHERDEFDNEDTTYIIGVEDGAIVAGARLLPADRPNLISEHFSHMCEDKGVPRAPDWADWTRMFVARDQRTNSRRGYLTQICAAVTEYCVDEGVRWAGGIQELYFLPQWSLYRWKVVPMGLPQKVAGEWALVAYIEMNERTLANVRKVLGADHSLIVRKGEPKPFVDGLHVVSRVGAAGG